MKTRFITAAFAAALALPMSALGHVAYPGPVYYVPATGPAVPAATVVTPAPQPLPAARPYLPPDAEQVGYYRGMTADVRGFYGFRAVPHSLYATDMAGVEVEFARYFSPRQAVTFTGSFGIGGNDDVNYVDTPNGRWPVSEDFTRRDFTLMAGYRFTQPLNRFMSLSFALKGGLDVQHLSYEDYWENHYDHHHGDRRDDNSYGETRCGFAYAAAVTLEARVSKHVLLMAGYQFRGSTTKADAPSVVPGGPKVSTSAIRWHEIHAGVRFAF